MCRCIFVCEVPGPGDHPISTHDACCGRKCESCTEISLHYLLINSLPKNIKRWDREWIYIYELNQTWYYIEFVVNLEPEGLKIRCRSSSNQLWVCFTKFWISMWATSIGRHLQRIFQRISIWTWMNIWTWLGWRMESSSKERESSLEFPDFCFVISTQIIFETWNDNLRDSGDTCNESFRELTYGLEWTFGHDWDGVWNHPQKNENSHLNFLVFFFVVSTQIIFETWNDNLRDWVTLVN